VSRDAGGAAGSAAAAAAAATLLILLSCSCLPGGDIAYPTKQHPAAAGLGTFADPITFAGAKAAVAPYSKIYVHGLKKYFAMEDDCGECIHDWKKVKKWHFDLWMGPDHVAPSSFIACENALTMDVATVTLDPPAGWPVDVTPLYTYNASSDNNGTCVVKSPPCHDKGTTCGNTCETWKKGLTCVTLAQTFLLPLTRFEALNPKLLAECKAGKAIRRASRSAWAAAAATDGLLFCI